MSASTCSYQAWMRRRGRVCTTACWYLWLTNCSPTSASKWASDGIASFYSSVCWLLPSVWFPDFSTYSLTSWKTTVPSRHRPTLRRCSTRRRRWSRVLSNAESPVNPRRHRRLVNLKLLKVCLRVFVTYGSHTGHIQVIYGSHTGHIRVTYG